MSRPILALAGLVVLAVGTFTLVSEDRVGSSVAPFAMETASTAGLVPQAAPATPTRDGYSTDRLSQSYGTVCETPRGECTVSPKPINGFCTCNGAPGKIIR